MNARELFENGRLGDAIEAQTAEVKAKPTDIDARYALAVYLCYAGELDRAFLQLNTIGTQRVDLAMAADVFKSHLIADLQRRKFYDEDAKPLLPPDCADYVDARLEALLCVRRGDFAAADAALNRATESESGRSGKLNGEAFDAIRDSDDFLGSILEVFAGENYLWVPFDQIRQLEVQPPEHLLDLLYIPARMIDVGGAEANVHIPALYPGSHLASEGRLQTGHMTDWIEVEKLGCRGVGQRELLVGRGGGVSELGVREVRSLEFDAVGSSESHSG